MRLLIISSKSYPTTKAGAEIVAKKHFEFALKKNFETYYLTSEFFPYNNVIYLKKNNKKIVRKIIADYFNPSIERYFKEVLIKLKPDIIHFHSIYGYPSRFFEIAKKFSKAVFITAHDYSHLCYFSSLKKINGEPCKNPSKCLTCFPPYTGLHRWIRKKHLKKTYLIAPSKTLAEHFRLYFNDLHIKIIQNGIDIYEKEYIPPQKRKYDILFVGRLEKQKGYDIFLKWILKKKDEKIRWVLIGTTNDKKKDAIIKNIAKNTNGIFYSQLGHNDVINIMANSKILLITSRGIENFPNVILEAASQGCIIFGVNRGGIKELFDEGINGIRIKENNIEEIDEEFKNLIKNQTLLHKMSINNINFIKNNFSWEKTFNQYFQLYEEVI